MCQSLRWCQLEALSEPSFVWMEATARSTCRRLHLQSCQATVQEHQGLPWSCYFCSHPMDSSTLLVCAELDTQPPLSPPPIQINLSCIWRVLTRFRPSPWQETQLCCHHQSGTTDGRLCLTATHSDFAQRGACCQLRSSVLRRLRTCVKTLHLNHRISLRPDHWSYATSSQLITTVDAAVIPTHVRLIGPLLQVLGADGWRVAPRCIPPRWCVCSFPHFARFLHVCTYSSTCCSFLSNTIVSVSDKLNILDFHFHFFKT